MIKTTIMNRIKSIKINVRISLLMVMLVSFGMAASAQNVISGIVSEMVGNTKEPVLGANVVLVNSQNRYIKGAVTDFNGNYTLQVPANAGKLKVRVSYIGMKTKTVNYNGQTTLNFTLESDEANKVKEIKVV